ncbi:MAG: thiol peroxidase [Enterococcus sp.]
MQVTRKGAVLNFTGGLLPLGKKAPAFDLQDQFDQRVQLQDVSGKPTVISVIPDIDTRVCALQTRRFNQEASQLKELYFLTISNNTKEEQVNWCGQAGVEMVMLHDPDNTFGRSYQLMIPDFGHFARSIIVLDAKGVVCYQEIVAEISQEPDYQKALAVAQSLI